MTTIAYTAGIMAADLMCSEGTKRIKVKHKLVRLKNGAVAGGAGDAMRLIQFLDWLDGEGALPDFEAKDKENDIEVLVAHPSGDLVVYNGLGQPMHLDEKHWAIGSGADFALAAMDFGKTAVEAVEYASRRDSGTGHGVESMTLGQPKARRARKKVSP